jgi:predicted transposase YdaD
MYRFERLSLTEVQAMLGISLEKSRAYQEIKQEGRQEGLQEGLQQATLNLVIRLLTKRFGELPADAHHSISILPLPVLVSLSEALLDFTSLHDLPVWLDQVKQ